MGVSVLAIHDSDMDPALSEDSVEVTLSLQRDTDRVGDPPWRSTTRSAPLRSVTGRLSQGFEVPDLVLAPDNFTAPLGTSIAA